MSILRAARLRRVHAHWPGEFGLRCESTTETDRIVIKYYFLWRSLSSFWAPTVGEGGKVEEIQGGSADTLLGGK